MTAKEKAIQLYNNYYTMFGVSKFHVMKAKRAATYCAYQIKLNGGDKSPNEVIEHEDFWLEVIVEIEKI